eukprot:136189-Karenia_brevis.AAC.1
MKGDVLGEWCEKKAKFWDAAVKGNSALQAALGAMIKDELAKENGKVRISLLWDLEKFYDLIALDKLVEAGLRYQYPPVEMLLGL